MSDDQDDLVRYTFYYGIDEDIGGLAGVYSDELEADMLAVVNKGKTMSWPQHIEMLGRGFVHRFGVHYLVPNFELDQNSGRWVKTGAVCWFC